MYETSSANTKQEGCGGRNWKYERGSIRFNIKRVFTTQQNFCVRLTTWNKQIIRKALSKQKNKATFLSLPYIRQVLWILSRHNLVQASSVHLGIVYYYNRMLVLLELKETKKDYFLHFMNLNWNKNKQKYYLAQFSKEWWRLNKKHQTKVRLTVIDSETHITLPATMIDERNERVKIGTTWPASCDYWADNWNIL